MQPTIVTFFLAFLGSRRLNAPTRRKCFTMGAVMASVVAVLLFSPSIVQAANWGDFQPDKCLRFGVRQYYSRLWNIPVTQSWDAACKSTPATINGISFSAATRCVDKGPLGEWGEFDVPDSSCPHWGDFQKDQCTAMGVRQYSSRLWDIPGGMDWTDACKRMGATINATWYNAPPNECKGEGAFGMWGKFNVPDPTCPHWGVSPGFRCSETTNGVREYLAPLEDLPPGVSWLDACKSTPADMGGVHFSTPTECKTDKRLGVFAVADPQCRRRSPPPPASKCPPIQTFACYTYKGQPDCASNNKIDHLTAHLECDQNGYFCCEDAQGVNDARCGRANQRSFPADCMGYHNTKVGLIQPSGCYERQDPCISGGGGGQGILPLQRPGSKR